MKCRQESSDFECVSCDSISLFLTSLVRNSQPLMGAFTKSTSRVKQEYEIELYVENILLQMPAWDKRSEKKLPPRKIKTQTARRSLSISKRDGQTRCKSFQVRSVHTGVHEARYPKGKDFSSKALVSLFRHR